MFQFIYNLYKWCYIFYADWLTHLHLYKTICRWINYIYSMQMDQFKCTSTWDVIYYMHVRSCLCTCAYVELNSIKMDKVVCIILHLAYKDGSSHLHLYICWVNSMQMDKVICIILHLVYADGSSNVHVSIRYYLF